MSISPQKSEENIVLTKAFAPKICAEWSVTISELMSRAHFRATSGQLSDNCRATFRQSLSGTEKCYFVLYFTAYLKKEPFRCRMGKVTSTVYCNLHGLGANACWEVPRTLPERNHSPSIPTPSEPLSVNTVWGTMHTSSQARIPRPGNGPEHPHWPGC